MAGATGGIGYALWPGRLQVPSERTGVVLQREQSYCPACPNF